MAKFKGTAYLDGGPDLLRARAATASRIQLHLVSAYTAGQSYATVLGNSLGNANYSASDIVSAGASGASRVTTFAGKSITLTGSASGTPDLHVAVLDTVSSEVHFVTDESSNPASVATGGTAVVPSFTDTQTQPT